VDYRPFLGIRWNGVGTQNPTNPAPVMPANSSSTMRNVNGSCYIRLPFTITPAQAALLTAPNMVKLHVRYDDGFFAWINGTLVKSSATIPAGTTPAWNTVISNTHDDTASTIYEEFDITADMSALHVGQNILALQESMAANTGSSDLLCQVKVTVVSLPGPFVPELTASATEYTAPISITSPTAIFARTLNPVYPSDPPTANGGGVGAVPNGSPWSAPARLYYFPGASIAAQATVQISEVNYHPPAPTAAEIAAGFTNSNDFEFIRITNIGATPVDLTGAYFSNGLEFTSPPGLQNWLPIGASVVVVENIAAFQSRYGTSFTILGEFKGELDNGGEHIVFNAKTGAIIADFIYNDTAPWPTSADGERSLVYVGGNQNLASSWRASLDPGGSGVSNYAIFAQRYFHGTTVPAADQLPGADPDGDGIVNSLEFPLALDPLIPDAPNFANPILSIRRRPAAGTNLTYTLQSTTDPAAGWIDGGAPISISPNADGTETAFYPRQNPTAPVEFLRMKITSP
jgi:hypothetical protein